MYKRDVSTLNNTGAKAPSAVEGGLDALALARLAEEYATEAVTITDPDLDAGDGPRIIHVNRAFERASGYPAQEIVGKRLGTLYSGSLLAEALTPMRNAAVARQEAEILLHARKRDGKIAWISGKIVPVFSASGNLMCLVRVTTDITARKRVEQEMHAAQQLLGSIFFVVDQGLAVVDDTARIAMANQLFGRALGVSLNDLLGRPFASWLGPAEAKAIDALRRTEPGKKSGERLNLRLKKPNGSPVEAQIISNIIDAQHEYCYLIVAVGREAMTAQPGPTTERPAAKPAPVAPAPTQTSQPPAERPPPPRPKEFGSAIREALANSDKTPAAVVTGKLQLIGLDEVRKALGDRWAEFESKTFNAAEAILRRHLGPRDAISRTQDDGFLVCFADLNEQEATFKAQALRREIVDRLIGESQELMEAKVTAHVSEVTINENEAVADFNIADAVEKRLKADKERREAVVRRSLWDEITPGRIRLDKVRTNTGQLAPLLRARLPTDLETAIENLDPHHEIGLAHEAGLLLVTAAAERLMQDQLSASQELVIVPVHISTLMEKRSREEWMKVARGIDVVGKARMLLEIHSLSKDIGQTRLQEIVTRCAPLFRALAIELPECDTPLINELPPSVRILTMPARRALAGPGLSAAFGRLMRTGGMRMRQLMVKDVARPLDAKLFANAGVALIAGRDSA
jgi:PAS domain S-box-containing protein